MSRFQTYYDLFEIAPNSTPGEIRAAYIRLMKRHHPDLRRPDEASSDVVATANRYYAILKDPSKRAAYDFTISRPTGQLRIAAGPKTRPSRTVSPWVIGMIAAVAILAGAAVPIIRGDGRTAEVYALKGDGDARGEQREVTMPTPDEVAQIVRRAISTPTARAAWISRQCYGKARAARSQAAAQVCVMFDEAALYSGSIWQDNLAGSTYFNPGLVRARQSGALAPFPGVDDAKLEQLRSRAFMQVLSEARVDNGADPSAPSPPAQITVGP
jgi:hypothetical protein